LNTRQITALISLSEQSEKPLGEIIDLFISNEKGIGATVKELGLNTKDALKGINGSFKDTKSTIKNAFKEAIKVVEEEDQEEVEPAVENSLTSNAAVTTIDVEAVTEKLEKVVKEAKVQIEALANKDADKAQKEIEKLEKSAEKAIEKIEKSTEKDADKIVNTDNDDEDKVDEDDSDDSNKADTTKNSEKENKGKSNTKN
ncbi:MAG TPA: hypothetical protein VMV86_01885, partial [Methanosarcinales archaeon]|nr:hypothetical protein [Methanosarcinales archaeon]